MYTAMQYPTVHFSLWDLCVLTLTNAFAAVVVSIIHASLTLLGRAMVRTQSFSWMRHRDMSRQVLAEIERTAWAAEMHDVFDFRTVPSGWIVGRRFSYVAHVEIDGSTIVIRYMTWRFLPPMCPSLADRGTHEIDVIRHSGCKLDEVDYFKAPELACPMGCSSRSASELAADRMLRAWRRDGQGRFILQGRPGCGKSTAARLLTHSIPGCVIYPTFDPTLPGENIAELMRYTEYRCQKVVLVIEEFDVILDKMIRMQATGSSSAPSISASVDHPSLRIEVTSKAGWNNMMDRLQFQSRFVLVLTTNASSDELRNLDAQLGGSLLRDGRITEWVRFDELKKNSEDCLKED